MCQVFFKEEDPIKLLNRIISKSLSVLNAERATVFLTSDFLNKSDSYKEGVGFVKCQDQLNSILAVGLEGEQISVDIKNSLAGSCYLSQQGFVCADAQLDPRFNSSIDQKTGFQTHSTLCVPLGGGAGVLQVLNSHAGNFSEGDLEKAKVLAFFASVALEHLKKLRALGDLQEGLAQYQNNEIMKPTSKLVSECPSLQEIYCKLPHIAKSDANVMITGGAGVGKEQLALHIHGLSLRAKKSCIHVNCALLSRQNIEEELLGSHDRFSQRVFGGKGKLDLAEGGTLLLSQVDKLTPALQTTLLKILKDHKSEKRNVATSGSQQRDFRLVSLASSEVKDQLEKRKFRQDLYYFLNVVGVAVPDMQSRIQDIPMLMESMLKELQIHNVDLKDKFFSKDCFELMMGQSWPGNLRQLKNAVESAALVSGSRAEIGANDFSGNINNSIVSSGGGQLLQFPGSSQGAQMQEREIFEIEGFKEAKRAFELEFVRRALEKNGGNKSKTAIEIGLSREALRKILLPRSSEKAFKKAA